MSAYLLILIAILSRVVPHPAWLNFTAVGGSLLYFGARRPLRQAILPVALLAATDYYLTVFAYSYPFHVSAYLITWAWYAGVILLGRALLAKHISAIRVGTAVFIAPTSFFLLTNFAAWIGSPLYPQTLTGLGMSYVPGGDASVMMQRPFIGNLLTSDPVRYARNVAVIKSGKTVLG